MSAAGKKNFLPPCHLTMGFGFLFKVDETSIARHLHERQPHAEDDQLSLVRPSTTLCSVTVRASYVHHVHVHLKILAVKKFGNFTPNQTYKTICGESMSHACATITLQYVHVYTCTCITGDSVVLQLMYRAECYGFEST